ncbi:MAG: hypothetical protein ABI134_01170, partial [Byssovorax sp.]
MTARTQVRKHEAHAHRAHAQPQDHGLARRGGVRQPRDHRRARELAEVVDRQLVRFEAGLIVERYVRGIDVACTFVDGIGADGVLDPIEYVIEPQH